MSGRSMQATVERTLASIVRDRARPLAGRDDDYDELVAQIGDARLVLLGEASHGTHEFYRERARITQRLVADKGFSAVAIEGDAPEARRVHRFVQGRGSDAFAVDALADFRRFPTWMWRNTDVVDFAERLREHNEALPSGEPKVGLFGLDLYSLHASMRAVLDYLSDVDPAAARAARERYACFDHVGEETQSYGFLTRIGVAPSCEEQVIRQLVETRRLAREAMRRDGEASDDDAFDAEQNARVVADAEEYYRSMLLRDVSTWNLRDEHMAETLDAIVAFLGRRRHLPKVVVWAHNSHVGDARATEMGRRGELNLGQLVRERHRGRCFNVGFTTHSGTVTAASDWDEPAGRKRVRPSREDSYERVFHDAGIARFMLPLREDRALSEALRAPRLERAIGVIYRPDTERQSHYFSAVLPDQFDAVLHFDATHAVEPLETTAQWRQAEHGEVPDTFPSGV